LLAIIAVAFAFYKALQKEKFKESFHRQVLSMPLFGRVSKGFNSSRVASTLSILSSSGVQLVEALKIAAENDVTLAFEPEVSNVVDSASKGRRLLDQMQSPYLKVVMDPANIFHQGELPRMREILPEAFDLLGEDIVIAHAKDLSRDGEAGHEAVTALAEPLTREEERIRDIGKRNALEGWRHRRHPEGDEARIVNETRNAMARVFQHPTFARPPH